MAESDDVVADLDQATTEVGVRLNGFITQVADLAAKLAAAQPGSERADALQRELDGVLARVKVDATLLHQFGRDPENPVPDAPNPDPTGGAGDDGGVDTSGDTPL